MLDPISVLLKFGFLLVLYLFLLWVARSALKDVAGTPVDPQGPPPDATGMHAASAGFAADPLGDRQPRLYVEEAVGLQPGSAYDLSDGLTLGRGDSVDVKLEDPFSSTEHARLVAQGSVVVLEDLGSTNGTYLNEELLRGPQPMHSGDRIRIGDSTFTYEH